VCYQLKILTTAVFSVFMLKRRLTRLKCARARRAARATTAKRKRAEGTTARALDGSDSRGGPPLFAHIRAGG
jgi:hypothetical protein